MYHNSQTSLKGDNMPKIVSGLTDSQVRNAKPKPRNNPREYRLASGRGLYLRVRSNGSRTWLFNYQKPFTKQRTNMGLGIYPDVSLALASKKRDKYRSLLAENIDPQEYELEQELEGETARANTFKVVAEKWLIAHKSKNKNKLSGKYISNIASSLENHIYPKLGKMPIHKITAPLAIGTLNPLVEAEQFEMVKRLCSRLNMIMNYAINTGIIPKGSNPLVGIKVHFSAPNPVKFPTIKPSELPALLETVNAAMITPVIRNLFYWQLHTMTRPGEAAGTRWEEIEGDIWTIPESRMKRGSEHKVLLTAQSKAILEAMRPESDDSEFVFPSRTKSRKHINSESVNMALKRMGYKGKLVSHGLRALASTTLNEQGHDAELIEVSLSHIDKNAVRAAYNRSDYLERRQALMAWWSDHITAAEAGAVIKGKKHLKIAG